MVTTGNVNGGLLLQWFIYPLPLGGVRGRLYLIRVAQASPKGRGSKKRRFTIYHSLFTFHIPFTEKEKRSTGCPSPYLDVARLSLLCWRRRRDIHVNLLRASAAKQFSSKNHGQSYQHNHEYDQYRHNACAAAATATISIVSHKSSSLWVVGDL